MALSRAIDAPTLGSRRSDTSNRVRSTTTALRLQFSDGFPLRFLLPHRPIELVSIKSLHQRCIPDLKFLQDFRTISLQPVALNWPAIPRRLCALSSPTHFVDLLTGKPPLEILSEFTDDLIRHVPTGILDRMALCISLSSALPDWQNI